MWLSRSTWLSTGAPGPGSIGVSFRQREILKPQKDQEKSQKEVFHKRSILLKTDTRHHRGNVINMIFNSVQNVYFQQVIISQHLDYFCQMITSQSIHQYNITSEMRRSLKPHQPAYTLRKKPKSGFLGSSDQKNNSIWRCLRANSFDLEPLHVFPQGPMKEVYLHLLFTNQQLCKNVQQQSICFYKRFHQELIQPVPQEPEGPDLYCGAGRKIFRIVFMAVLQTTSPMILTEIDPSFIHLRELLSLSLRTHSTCVISSKFTRK